MSTSRAAAPVRNRRLRIVLVTTLTVLVVAIGVWDWFLVRGAWPAWQPAPSVAPAALEPIAEPAEPAPAPQQPPLEPAAPTSAPEPEPAAVARSPDPPVPPQPTYIWRMTPPPAGSAAAVPMIAPQIPVAVAPEDAASPAARATSPDVRKVTAIVLNVRAGPSAGTPRVGRLRLGTAVIVLEAPGRWVRIAAADGTTGWVSSRYLRR